MVRLLLRPLRTMAGRLEAKVGKQVIRQQFQAFGTTARTLDLGCGRSPMAEVFPDRVGLDIVPGDGVDVVADAHRLPFAAGAFSQLVCSEVLEHLADPAAAAAEMGRVLAAGGQLVLTTPFVYPIHEAPHDYQRFTAYGLRRLFNSAGFEIGEVKALFDEEQTLAILLQRVAFQRRDSVLRHFLYLLLAHLVYRLSGPARSPRYQNLSRSVPGHFLTAGYLLVARRK